MTNRRGIEEVLSRVRRFEEDLKFIGVSVKVDVRASTSMVTSTALTSLRPACSAPRMGRGLPKAEAGAPASGHVQSKGTQVPGSLESQT